MSRVKGWAGHARLLPSQWLSSQAAVATWMFANCGDFYCSIKMLTTCISVFWWNAILLCLSLLCLSPKAVLVKGTILQMKWRKLNKATCFARLHAAQQSSPNLTPSHQTREVPYPLPKVTFRWGHPVTGGRKGLRTAVLTGRGSDSGCGEDKLLRVAATQITLNSHTWKRHTY